MLLHTWSNFLQHTHIPSLLRLGSGVCPLINLSRTVLKLSSKLPWIPARPESAVSQIIITLDYTSVCYMHSIVGVFPVLYLAYSLIFSIFSLDVSGVSRLNCLHILLLLRISMFVEYLNFTTFCSLRTLD